MPRVEQNSMPISLHYALTDSQCSICGGQLEWQADFDSINGRRNEKTTATTTTRK